MAMDYYFSENTLSIVMCQLLLLQTYSLYNEFIYTEHNKEKRLKSLLLTMNCSNLFVFLTTITSFNVVVVTTSLMFYNLFLYYITIYNNHRNLEQEQICHCDCNRDCEIYDSASSSGSEDDDDEVSSTSSESDYEGLNIPKNMEYVEESDTSDTQSIDSENESIVENSQDLQLKHIINNYYIKRCACCKNNKVDPSKESVNIVQTSTSDINNVTDMTSVNSVTSMTEATPLINVNSETNPN